MVEVPAATVVTSPDEAFTVATEVEPLVQLPPALASLNVCVPPIQELNVPVIVDGIAFTVTSATLKQLPPKEYVMVDVPLATPITRPVDEPTEA